MMLSLRSKLFKQLENANDDELASLKNDFDTLSKDWKERIAVRERIAKLRKAKATFPQDQKFIDSIEIKKCKIFQSSMKCDYDCDCCCDLEWEERDEFEQELIFDFGFSANEIKDAIPERGSGRLFACLNVF